MNYTFSFKRTPFNSSYAPNEHTRLTTNFANISKNPIGRKERIESILEEINNQLNTLAGTHKIFKLSIDIISAEIRFEGDKNDWFPLFEFLDVTITNELTGEHFDGPLGCNFSSYIRDYDFKLVLPSIFKTTNTSDELADFGNLHAFFFNLCYEELIAQSKTYKPFIIAISVGNGKEYIRNGFTHPILGYEYVNNADESITTRYLSKIGLSPNYFLAKVGKAPLAIYCKENTLLKQHPLAQAALIAIMNVFQQIYRPEIYCSTVPVDTVYIPNLENKYFEPTSFAYDREERDQVLSINQALFVKENFLDKNATAINKLVIDSLK